VYDWKLVGIGAAQPPVREFPDLCYGGCAGYVDGDDARIETRDRLRLGRWRSGAGDGCDRGHQTRHSERCAAADLLGASQFRHCFLLAVYTNWLIV
jgi:hypothetical protein